MERNIPFPLLFEEPGSGMCRTIPEYDEDLEISIVRRGNEKIPFVILGHGLGTQTFTRMEIESTDRDAHQVDVLEPALYYGLGTRTFTDVLREVTDSDRGES